jgi:hypothetical protein
VVTAESTSSATYVDLTTPGPSISVTVPASGKVLVSVTSGVTAGNGSTSCAMSFATSGTGATATSAADARAVILLGNSLQAASATYVVTGLNPVSTTFTAKYEAKGSSSCTFSNRSIWAIPLP